MVQSDEGVFWDRRYRSEGSIWGEEPSPSALLAALYLTRNSRVLDIGFGYGRDLLFLRRRRCQVFGVELSGEGHRQALARLKKAGVKADQLGIGCFEASPLGEGDFDMVLSHRMGHLLVTRDAIAQFACKVHQVLQPGGRLVIGVRNMHDLNPAEMIPVGDGVYEYQNRPGHRIRYWTDAMFQHVFGKAFTILKLVETTEVESVSRPIPCHLTVMVATKR